MNDHPIFPVIVTKARILPLSNPITVEENPYEYSKRAVSYTFNYPNLNFRLTLWAWIKAGWFPLSFSFGILIFFHSIIKKLDSYKLKKE